MLYFEYCKISRVCRMYWEECRRHECQYPDQLAWELYVMAPPVPHPPSFPRWGGVAPFIFIYFCTISCFAFVIKIFGKSITYLSCTHAQT